MNKKKCVHSKDGTERAGKSPAARNATKKNAVSKRSREDQEILIRTVAGEHDWHFWAADTEFIRLVEKLGDEPIRDHQYGWICRVPLGRVKVRLRQRR